MSDPTLHSVRRHTSAASGCWFEVDVAEWLRRGTANPLGYARASSNLVVNDFVFSPSDIVLFHFGSAMLASGKATQKTTCTCACACTCMSCDMCMDMHICMHCVTDLPSPLPYLTNNQAGAQIYSSKPHVLFSGGQTLAIGGEVWRRKAGEEPAYLNASAVGGARPNPSRAACS